MAQAEKLTLYEIAELAGTSKSTVSRVLNGGDKVSPKVKARVMQVIAEQNYMPSIAARGLSMGRKNMIAVISGGISDGYFAGVIRGIDIESEDRNNHLLCSFGRNEESFIKLWQGVIRQGLVDGVILVAPPNALMQQPFDCELPVVLCSSRPAPNHGWDQVSTVTVDNRAGLTAMLDKMYASGARSFVHFAGPNNDYDAIERREAFKTFIATHQDCSGQITGATKSRDKGYENAVHFLKKHPHPDAMVCYNDSTAAGVLTALEENGLTGKVKISGCDSGLLADMLQLPTLKMPCEKIGREAAAMLFSLINSTDRRPQHKILTLTPQRMDKLS